MSPKLVQTYPLTVQKQEIDIMRKSSPINLRFTVFCHCQNQNGTSFLVQSVDAISSVTVYVDKKQTKQPKHY